MFKNEIYTAEISVSDTSGDSVEGSGLHNTTTQKYCVYEMGTDETALKLDKDAVKSIIEKVDSGQEQSWSKLEFDKNGKDEITVGKAKDKEAAENNYLILVKTIDNTGNEAVYASNGIVVDVTSPKVECTFDTSKDGGYVSEKDGILCYQGDAKYELKIEDPEEYFSSISKLEVIVSKDGETITPTTKEFDADETYEDCLIDFNISLDGSVTQEVQGLSRRYASPEQFRCAMDKMYGRKSSETLDERMDIYSLGAVFYRMMSGYLPDAQNGVPYALSQIDIPYADGLKRIVDKAMDRDVSRRFRTAKQMEEALSHMEKYDPKYRRLTNLQILTATAWGFCILAGIFLIASGVRQRGKELWQQEYQEFYAVVGSGDSENIIREGTELLNNSSLQGYMKRNKEQKAEVLHAVGDGYFYSEQYDTAGKYYEEALSCDSRNSLYVRDYMTAMARNGSPVDVWTIQSEYPEAAIDEAATVFVQAQSMYAKGDQKSAVSLCEEALGKSMDAELNAQIYLLEAELYLEQGDINSAADAAAQAVKLDESSNVLRKAAVTAYQAGNEERIGTVKNQWYRQALAYYEMLCQKNDPSYEDRLGRALLLRVLGKYRDSTDVLEEMKIDYPKDYKVQMWILQTYILSMATLYHPYEAAFVIIDFKGGGMVNQFAQLPHLLGAITNIDGNAINRSLKSIKAELQKRQKYFAQADVNHIDKYIRKYKAGEVSEPLPHLIIIVDEFAELKAEQPEFMKELISAARIGRSLGVHLILATQKPAGQVNEQIWSNSRFKLCLKVQSKEDSNEVLKSPLAAEIKEPGRAYLQVGNNEIFELFQSAYSGVPEREDEGTGKAFTIYEVPDGGKKVPVYVKKKNKGQEGMNNQLEAIVSYVSEYFRSIQIPQLPDICLPPLRECIEFPPVSKEAVQEQKKEVGFYAWIGVYDDPDHQNQDQYAVNLSAANMIIIGSAQTGKTTILQNVIRSLSEQYTPDEVAIYIIDFASMVLKNFETLNHVGGVVSSSEDEKLKNLFKMLWEEMETRKEKLLSVGVSSFVAYKEAGRTDMKQIVLIIDNLTALKELYFQDDDELLNLCREGITVGISIVIANAQTAGIGYKYLSSFSNRIALFCNDGNEYSAIFEHCNRRLEHLPGRCFAEVDKQILECQAYLPFAGEKEFERAEAIRGYIEKRNGECTEVARKIPLIPPVLSMNYMAQQFGNMMRGHFDLAAGLNYEDVMPYMLRMSSIGVLAVVGREGSGRYNWIKYVADMRELMYPGRSKVYISDGIGKKLASMKEKRNVVRYSMIAEDIVSYLKEIEEELQSRYELLAKGIESDPAEADYMLLIIDNPDAIEQISNSKEALASYKNIIGRYRNMNVGVIISAIENAPIPYSAPEVIKGIRDGRHLMYFGDISELKIYDMPLAVTRKFKKPIETGDGYYIKENECIKLKTPFIAGE